MNKKEKKLSKIQFFSLLLYIFFKRKE